MGAWQHPSPWTRLSTVISTHRLYPELEKCGKLVREAYLSRFREVSCIISGGRLSGLGPEQLACAISRTVQDHFRRDLQTEQSQVLQMGELLKLDLSVHVFLAYDPDWDQNAADIPITSAVRGASYHNWQFMTRRINQRRVARGLVPLLDDQHSPDFERLNDLLGLFLPQENAARIPIALTHLYGVLWRLTQERREGKLWTVGKTMVVCGLLIDEIRSWLDRASESSPELASESTADLPLAVHRGSSFEPILKMCVSPGAATLDVYAKELQLQIYRQALQWYGEWWERSGLNQKSANGVLRLKVTACLAHCKLRQLTLHTPEQLARGHLAQRSLQRVSSDEW